MYLEIKIEELCQGYLRYKFSSLGGLVPLLGRVFIWLSGDPRIPASRGARLLKDRAVKEPFRSFTVPEEGPYYYLKLLIILCLNTFSGHSEN